LESKISNWIAIYTFLDQEKPYYDHPDMMGRFFESALHVRQKFGVRFFNEYGPVS